MNATALLPSVVDDVGALDLTRSGAIVVAGLVATHHSSTTWINSQVLLLVSAAVACCLWPRILLETALDHDAVDDTKVLLTRYLGLMIGAYVTFMFRNRKTKDNRIWFSVFLTGTLCSVILVWTQLNGGKLLDIDCNINPLNSNFVSFPSMTVAVFFHGNLWHLLWFDAKQIDLSHKDKRAQEHLMLDLMLQVPSLVMGLCYPHVICQTLSLGNYGLDTFHIYQIQSITALNFALIMLSLLALNFADVEAKINLLSSKALLMTSLCVLLTHHWMTSPLTNLAPLFVALAPHVIAGLNAAWACQPRAIRNIDD